MTPDQLKKRLQKISIRKEAARVINQNSSIIADAQRAQMLDGRRNDGKPIVPKYSKGYAIKKGKTTPDLYVTGAFQDAITVKATEDTLNIKSTDSKNNALVKKYENIFGLDTKSKKNIQPLLQELLANRIAVLLKF